MTGIAALDGFAAAFSGLGERPVEGVGSMAGNGGRTRG